MINRSDYLLAALGYPIPAIALFVLLNEEKKDLPFLKYHAVQAIAFAVIWVLIFSIVSVLTLGFGAVICGPLILLATLWPAIDAYKGNYTEIPFITDMIKREGWVD